MFHTIFVFAIIITYVVITATGIRVPFVPVCGRNNSNYNKCIMDNINHVKDKICKESSEFKFPIIDPLFINKIVIFDEPNVKLHLINTSCNGFCDIVIQSVHTDPNKLQFNFDFVLKHLNMDTSYDFDVRLLVPIAHKGKCQIFTNDIKVKVTLDLKVITKNGKKHIYVSKANTNAELKDFEYEFDESEKELVQLHEIINNIVNDNKQIIIDKVKPVIEKRLSELFIQIFNDITLSNYEKFFPEKV